MSSLNTVARLDLPNFDTAIDFVGNPYVADLVLYLNGNQFMVMPELLNHFRQQHPAYARIYYETLPPGLLAAQIQNRGHIHLGSLELIAPADVYTAGKMEMNALKSHVVNPQPYAQNQLALVVAAGNPRNIQGFEDLARQELTIAMPNPETEGIARLAMEAVRRRAGDGAVKTLFEDKVKNGSCRLTTVHHRETLAWLVSGQVDVGVVWQSEAQWAIHQGKPIASVPLDHWKGNPVGQYWVSPLSDAPHPQAAQDFVDYLLSGPAQAIYQKYGFTPAGSDVFSGF